MNPSNASPEFYTCGAKGGIVEETEEALSLACRVQHRQSKHGAVGVEIGIGPVVASPFS